MNAKDHMHTVAHLKSPGLRAPDRELELLIALAAVTQQRDALLSSTATEQTGELLFSQGAANLPELSRRLSYWSEELDQAHHLRDTERSSAAIHLLAKVLAQTVRPR
jgi:hypothetical protein